MSERDIKHLHWISYYIRGGDYDRYMRIHDLVKWIERA